MSFLFCPTEAAMLAMKQRMPVTPDGVHLGDPAAGEDGSFVFSHPFSERERNQPVADQTIRGDRKALEDAARSGVDTQARVETTLRGGWRPKAEPVRVGNGPPVPRGPER